MKACDITHTLYYLLPQLRIVINETCKYQIDRIMHYGCLEMKQWFTQIGVCIKQYMVS
jgi:hypothetical protein